MPASEAAACYKVCCDLYEPDGTDCAGEGKITDPKTWGCMVRCLKLPDPKNPNPRRRGSMPARFTRLAATTRVRTLPSPLGDVCPKETPVRCRDGSCAKDWTFCPDKFRNPTQGRVPNGCYHPGKLNHPGRAVVACRMQNGRSAQECFDLDTGEPMDCMGAPKGSCINNRGCITVAVDCQTGETRHHNPRNRIRATKSTQCAHLTRGVSTFRRLRNPNARLLRRAKARLSNPGPDGQALPVPPFCAAGDCGRVDCGTCNPHDYAVPGRVRTVLEAVDQMRRDVSYAMGAASDQERAMRAIPPFAWSDPNVALRQKPGGPAPYNPVSTAQWEVCLPGPAVVADPSSNFQQIPGATP